MLLQEYIARFGHGSAKLARQAQSKEKTLEKMVRSGLTEKVSTDSIVKIAFTDVPKLPPPVLQFSEVTFGYSKKHILYTKVNAPPTLPAPHLLPPAQMFLKHGRPVHLLPFLSRRSRRPHIPPAYIAVSEIFS